MIRCQTAPIAQEFTGLEPKDLEDRSLIADDVTIQITENDLRAIARS
jgi:hypothetical protein